MRQHAMRYQINGLFEATANDSGHDLTWGWRDFGLFVPGARPVTRRGLTNHRSARGSGRARGSKDPTQVAQRPADTQGQQPAPWRRRRRQLAKEISRCGETGHSSQAQRRRGKLRLGRDLLEVRPARPHDCVPLFSRETEFTKFVGREIATARSRHASRWRRIPMAASPRHRARCNRHEARAGIVPSCRVCLARLSNGGLGPPGEIASLPACTQRSVRRGAPSASRLDLLAFCGDKRGRSKALFFRCAGRNSHLRSSSSQIFMRPRKLSKRAPPFRVDSKRYHLSHHLPYPCCTCTITRLASRFRGARLLPFRGPRRAWRRLFILCCD